jgi:hypothetical protein
MFAYGWFLCSRVRVPYHSAPDALTWPPSLNIITKANVSKRSYQAAAYLVCGSWKKERTVLRSFGGGLAQ